MWRNYNIGQDLGQLHTELPCVCDGFWKHRYGLEWIDGKGMITGVCGVVLHGSLEPGLWLRYGCLESQ